ncbi:reverse transcriptase domain-containing protein [Tanacetum coccineum]
MRIHEGHMERYKAEILDVEGASECMKISGFMHGITHPELIKRLYEKILRLMDEMYRVTTSFLQGEVAAFNYSRKKVLAPWKQPEGGNKPNFKKGFKNKQRSDRKPDRFSLLTKTPKEIFALEKGKFKAPPPMLRKQIDEIIKSAHNTPVTVQRVLEEKIKVVVHPEYPEQTIAIGSTLTEKGRKELCALLKQNLDVFAWKPADMTGVPRHMAEHRLNVREGCPPVRQKKRGQAPERNKAIQEEVEKLVDVGIMKEVHYHSWLSNPVMVKKHDGSWRIFLSKSAKKSLSFFKTLKKCTKKSDFQWTQEAEVAFKQMKKLIAELPMLTAPKEKEELIMYLAAAKEAISAILITERGGKQLPVYFVSRALRGPKINYTPMEKLVLALLSASRRLKRYFQAHTIVVITDQPIKQLLSKSKISGRMLKWKFELEGYDIQYRPRTSIKGQILADFIVERPDEESPDELMAEPEELPKPWTLFTDGSSCIDGSGAGLILTNPEGVEFTYAMRFRFEATNNEAEYEALIAGLRIAEQMGIKKTFKQM